MSYVDQIKGARFAKTCDDFRAVLRALAGGHELPGTLHSFLESLLVDGPPAALDELLRTAQSGSGHSVSREFGSPISEGELEEIVSMLKRRDELAICLVQAEQSASELPTPESLDEQAKAEWARIQPELHRMEATYRDLQRQRAEATERATLVKNYQSALAEIERGRMWRVLHQAGVL